MSTTTVVTRPAPRWFGVLTPTQTVYAALVLLLLAGFSTGRHAGRRAARRERHLQHREPQRGPRPGRNRPDRRHPHRVARPLRGLPDRPVLSLVAAETMDGDPGQIVWGVLAALLVGAVVGLANGLIITSLRVNAFIATLGVALIIRGYLEENYTDRPAMSRPPSDVSAMSAWV